MGLVVREIVGSELDSIKAEVTRIVGGVADDAGMVRWYIVHIRAVEIDPIAARDTEWYQEWDVDQDANVIVRFSEGEAGHEYPGVTGWNLVLTRNEDGSYDAWGGIDEGIGSSGPAYNGVYSHDSQIECKEWVDKLPSGDLNDIWL